MVIHPLIQAREKSRLEHLLEADEAIGLARAAKLDILPGPTYPRMGWSDEQIQGQIVPQDSALTEYVTVKDTDIESDDEMDMDDPLWNDPSIRKQYAESTIVRVDKIDPVWFFGQGKVEEIAVAISKMPPRYVFVNTSLTHTQVKQLEESFYGGLLSFLSAKKQSYLETSRPKQQVGYRGEDEAEKYQERISTYIPKSIEVFDRPRMILEIFATRASSPLAKLQCDIAKMHFTKVNLGVGNIRKAREVMNSLQTTVTPFREIPATIQDGVRVDNSEYNFTEHKEKVDTLLRKLNKKMDEAMKAREQHRNNRVSNYVTVGLVGYTNAGKTQLLNQLVGNDDLKARDLLFQTLDSSTRAISLPNGSSVLVTDSIGFIRDLPHFLFTAFKATIDDIVSCDFLILVRDISHPLTDDQAETVRSTLMDAGFTKNDIQERIVEVWNKIDEVDPIVLKDMLQAHPHVVPVSALSGDGIDNLLHVIEAVATKISGQERIRVSFPLRDLNERMNALRSVSDRVYEDSLDCDSSGEFMSVEVLIRPDALTKYNAKFPIV
jgi:50S ribosomal subunit-associated GTPase HflX